MSRRPLKRSRFDDIHSHATYSDVPSTFVSSVPDSQRARVLQSTTPKWITRRGVQNKNNDAAMRSWLRVFQQPHVIQGRHSNGASPEIQHPDYADDPCDSDNEFVWRRGYRNDNVLTDTMLSVVLEDFHSTWLAWHISPHETTSENLVDANADWVDFWVKFKGRNVFPDVSFCQTSAQYKAHWCFTLAMELRGALVDALKAKCPVLHSSPAGFLRKLHGSVPSSVANMIRLVIRKVSHSKHLTNFSCDSTDVSLTKQIVDEMSGMTACIGYLSDYNGKVRSPLTLFFCQRIHVQSEDIDKVGLAGRVDYAQISICANRRLISNFQASAEDVIHVQCILSIASVVRMYQAVLRVDVIPHDILSKILHASDSTPQFLPSSRPVPQPLEDMIQGIHPNVVNYLKACLEHKSYNQMQVLTVMRFIRGIQDGSYGSVSLEFTQGPPATGKTSTISLLSGCVMHDPRYGHVGREQFNLLGLEDSVLRCSKDIHAFRILVCCPSNQATDNVLKRIKDGSIPDGKGGHITPAMVRIARQGYNYDDLDDCSLNNRGLLFDRNIFNCDDGSTRISASTRARRAAVEESVIVGMTLSLAGGSNLKALKASFDLVIIDEAAQSMEPETLIPLVATRKLSRLRRLHVAAFGDQNQLPTVSDASFMMKDSLIPTAFNYDFQMRSLFERFLTSLRNNHVVLNEQYRMHPAIATAVLPLFYDITIKSPKPAHHFTTLYNSLSTLQKGYEPVTILDTRLNRHRAEDNNGVGKIRNVFEVEVVLFVVYDLLHLVGANVLTGRICILAPYLDQVQALQDARAASSSLRNLDIHIDSIDSMQGAERDIVIFSGTRSNKRSQVGFLRDWRRLNVAMSRSRNLLVIVGDMSTLCDGALPAFDGLMRVAKSDTLGVRHELFINGDEEGQKVMDAVARLGGNIRRK